MVHFFYSYCSKFSGALAGMFLCLYKLHFTLKICSNKASAIFTNYSEQLPVKLPLIEPSPEF